MHLRLVFVFTTIAALCPFTLPAQEGPSHIEQIINANSLNLPGKAPFHLKIEFQLYSTSGKRKPL